MDAATPVVRWRGRTPAERRAQRVYGRDWTVLRVVGFNILVAPVGAADRSAWSARRWINAEQLRV